MKQQFEESNYVDLKREIDLVRKKVDDMEAGHFCSKTAAHASYWSKLSRKSTSVLTAVVVVMLLAVLGMGWQSKSSSLFIDQNGKVGINTLTPEKTLDVNGDALFRQPVAVDALTVTNDATFGKQLRAANNGTLDLVGPTTMAGRTTMNSDLRLGNSDMYFTNPGHTYGAIGDELGWAAMENVTAPYNSLMILGRTVELADKKSKLRDITMWDRVAIGKANPETPLDVKGEFRGKPWFSKEYEWKQGEKAVQMTRIDRTVCFLTLVSGQLFGGGEVVQITPQSVARGGNKYWELWGISGTRDVRAKARCIGVPDDEVW